MGFRDWFVTAAHHREVCALYEQRLVVAAERATEERARADREVDIRRELEQRLVDNLFSKPGAAEPRRVHRAPEEKTTRVEVPLSLDDEQGIIKQAMKETGSRNARQVAARAQHIRDRLARGEHVTRKAPLKMPIPEIDNLINQTLKDADEEAYALSQQQAAAARAAAS